VSGSDAALSVCPAQKTKISCLVAESEYLLVIEAIREKIHTKENIFCMY